MEALPDRLIPSEARVAVISENRCGSCILLRRTSLERLRTPGGEIDPDVWQSRDIFGLSVNIYLCNNEELAIESEKEDVNLAPVEADNTKFISDWQKEEYDYDTVYTRRQITCIAYMTIDNIENLKGTYPFAKGTPKEKFYGYELKVEIDPLMINVFHAQVQVYTDESGDWNNVSRHTSKGSLRSLATKIRSTLIRENLIDELLPSVNL